MNKIIIRKVFPYDPTANGKYSRYEGYTKSVKQEIDLPIVKSIELKLSDDVKQPIYTSSLLRAVQSAELLAQKNDKQVRELSLLNEIKFDLTQLVTKQEFEKFGSSLVRERFVDRFKNDKLLEKRSDIKKGC